MNAAAYRQAAYRARRRAERVEVDGVLVHPGAPHGTPHAYNGFGCRCEQCRAGWAAYVARDRCSR